MGYLYDCHVHTSEVSPCGKVPAQEMAQLYKEAGYSGIVVTDHYYDGYFNTLTGSWDKQVDAYLMGYRMAKAVGDEIGLDVLLGLELRFVGSPEDYLVYGVDEEFLRTYPRLYEYTLMSFYDLVEDMDILIIQAHPFRPGLKVASPHLLHGVEVYNGNPRHNSRNDLALEYGERHRLIMTASSDAHQYGDIGRGGMYLSTPIQNGRELVQWLREHPRPMIKKTGKEAS